MLLKSIFHLILKKSNVFLPFIIILFCPSYLAAQGFKWVEKAGDNNKFINYGAGIALDHDKNVIVTGTYSNGFLYGALALPETGEQSIFLSKHDSLGKLDWVRTIGGDSLETAAAVATDTSGNIFVVGNMLSPTIYFDRTDSLKNRHLSKGWNSFLAKYSSSGNLLWTRALNGPHNNKTLSVTCSASGEVIIGGYYDRILDMGDTLLRGGLYNIFLAKFSTSGTLLWASTAKSNHTSFIKSLAVDATGAIYATGKLSGPISFENQVLGSVVDQRFTGSSLPATFTASAPDAKLDYTPDGILVSGGVDNFNNYLNFNRYSNLENFKVESNIKVVAHGLGLGFGKYAGTFVMSKFPLRSGSNNVTILSSSGTMCTSDAYEVAIGDSLTISLSRSHDTISARLVNHTQDYTVSTGYRYTTRFRESGHYMPSNGFYGLVFFGGTQYVTNYTLSSTENRNALCLFVGNSITTGYFSGDRGNRYQDVLYKNSPYLYATNAGSGDRLMHALLDTSEIIELNPKYVFVNIGVNDANAGVDTAAFETDYRSLILAFKRHGITPVVGTLTPQTISSVLPFNRRIAAIALSESLPLVDIYTELVDPASGKIKASCNSTDDIHPNAFGNAEIARAISEQAPFLLADTSDWGKLHDVVSVDPGKDRVFTAKFSAAGAPEWINADTSRVAYASSEDATYSCGNGIAVDPSGRIVVGGCLLDTLYTDVTSVIALQSGFLNQYNSSGNLIWQKRFEPAERNAIEGVGIVPSGNSYVIGNYSETMTIDTNVLPAPLQTEFYIARFDASGNAVWLKKSSGYSDYGLAIAVYKKDSMISIATTGTYNNNLKLDSITAGTTIPESPFNYNVFVAYQEDEIKPVLSIIKSSIPGSGFIIFPNPASDHVIVKSGRNGNFDAQLTDLSGKSLLCSSSKNNIIDFNISPLSPGIYFIKIREASGGYEVIKLLKR